MTTTIRIERSFDCRPGRVWDAWTKPDLLDRWFCPNPDLRVSSHADAREGGAYRVNMGGEYIVSGSYQRLEEPAVLECTWQWEHETLTTLLRVEFAQRGSGGTDLVLVHSDFTDAADAEATREGWELSLDRLAQLLAG
ncbi:SRPBCC domain-containing protein [Propioniciclava sinopodophylli]|uniref:SRPBCC domain-containing protein n=1 Tax=Propioniciclava sinopodophylli TaxID=1837344 RepID=A0A4Q9KBS4_9ACTN|nr:SRPBCC domain-containing protein [Propioniciclava sinopodophylli]TBT83367.1 SRPBCC domain-containing protein [Propioniciclava sinopodophylli]